MAEKAVARVGDTGSHGGAIITGAAGVLVNSRPMARVGDTYNCPLHGPNPIVTGALNVFGQDSPIAHVGSKTACGAIIVSGSPDTFVDAPTPGEAVPAFEMSPEAGSRYFVLVDHNDKPIPDADYIITDADGTEYPGTTDQNGHTATIFGKTGDTLTIKILTSDDDCEDDIA